MGSEPGNPLVIHEDRAMECPRCRRVGRQIRECDEHPCELQGLRDIADAHDRDNERMAAVEGYQMPTPEMPQG